MLYVVGIVLIEHNNIYIRQVINRIVGVLQTEKLTFPPLFENSHAKISSLSGKCRDIFFDFAVRKKRKI